MLRALYIAIILALTGCAVTGPSFTAIEHIAAGQGVVYVYRPDLFVNKGIKPGISVDGQEYAALPAGGYMPFSLNEGIHHFGVILSKNYSGNAGATMLVTAGAKSFLRLDTFIEGAGYQRIRRVFRLTPVSDQVGDSEIKSSTLVDPNSGNLFSSSIFFDD
jgi:hypothetical protein